MSSPPIPSAGTPSGEPSAEARRIVHENEGECRAPGGPGKGPPWHHVGCDMLAEAIDAHAATKVQDALGVAALVADHHEGTGPEIGAAIRELAGGYPHAIDVVSVPFSFPIGPALETMEDVDA